MHTKESLVAFEKKVADAFLEKRVPGPIHLSGGNEEQLIAIFKDVKPNDWVFSTWRSHYHALLKGLPEEWIFNEILAGRSMYLMNHEYKFLSSAIVGGILPIALGVAMGIKRETSKWETIPSNKQNELASKVWVFVGDMTARSGLYMEFRSYCYGHNLPVRMVIEDNGISTNTPTDKVWGEYHFDFDIQGGHQRYKYERTYPHVGCGVHVAF